MLNLTSIYFAHERESKGYPFNSLIYRGIDSGLIEHLSTEGQTGGPVVVGA